MKGLLCRGPAKEMRLQTETWQMELALGRGHLWGGREDDGFWVLVLHCYAVAEGTRVQIPVQLWNKAPGTGLYAVAFLPL